MGRGLSDMQKDVLLEVHRRIRRDEESDSAFMKAMLYRLNAGGVSIFQLRGMGRRRSRSNSAAFSRALKRLEQRGLIVRLSTPKGRTVGHVTRFSRMAEKDCGRTDIIVLTDAGRAEAERLSVNIEHTNV
jgi:DNA-binding MarR family transcriptional regulator